MEKELIDIWQSTGSQKKIKINTSKLMINVQSDFDKTRMVIKIRNYIEIGAALMMIPLFAGVVFYIPFMFSKIGASIIVLWCIYVIVKLGTSTKSKTTAFSESNLNYLIKTKDYFISQKSILDTVIYWYILPPTIGLILFFIGFPMPIEKLMWFISFPLGVGVVTFLLNKYASNKQLLPKILRVEKMITSLNED